MSLCFLYGDFVVFYFIFMYLVEVLICQLRIRIIVLTELLNGKWPEIGMG